MAKDGKFVAGSPPYGCKKSAEDRHKLVIDGEAAEVVKRIFEMRAKGVSAYAIAKILIKENVSSPSDYKYQKAKDTEPTDKHFWYQTAVSKVLANPVYIGSIAGKRSFSKNYKLRKRIKNAKEDWVIVPNMHEPIISKELWQSVQDINEKNVRVRSTKSSTINPFSSMMRCKDCGSLMTKGSTKTYDFFVCSRHRNAASSVC